jgi:hypothetical protein
LGPADPLAQLGRRQPAVERHEPLDRPDLFRDGEVGTVDVLAEHRLDDLGRGHGTDHSRHDGQPGLETGGVSAVPGDDPIHAVVVGGEHDEGFQDAVRADRADQLGQITQAAARIVRVGGEVGQLEPAQLRLNRHDPGIGGGFGDGHSVAPSRVEAMDWIHGRSGVSVATRCGSMWAQVSSDARTHTSPCSASTRRAALIATPSDDVCTC